MHNSYKCDQITFRFWASVSVNAPLLILSVHLPKDTCKNFNNPSCHVGKEKGNSTGYPTTAANLPTNNVLKIKSFKEQTENTVSYIYP
jgi:hypothetical protein